MAGRTPYFILHEYAMMRLSRYRHLSAGSRTDLLLR
jgi:hypothetical protein